MAEKNTFITERRNNGTFVYLEKYYRKNDNEVLGAWWTSAFVDKKVMSRTEEEAIAIFNEAVWNTSQKIWTYGVHSYYNIYMMGSINAVEEETADFSKLKFYGSRIEDGSEVLCKSITCDTIRYPAKGDATLTFTLNFGNNAIYTHKESIYVKPYYSYIKTEGEILSAYNYQYNTSNFSLYGTRSSDGGIEHINKYNASNTVYPYYTMGAVQKTLGWGKATVNIVYLLKNRTRKTTTIEVDVFTRLRYENINIKGTMVSYTGSTLNTSGLTYYGYNYLTHKKVTLSTPVNINEINSTVFHTIGRHMVIFQFNINGYIKKIPYIVSTYATRENTISADGVLHTYKSMPIDITQIKFYDTWLDDGGKHYTPIRPITYSPKIFNENGSHTVEFLFKGNRQYTVNTATVDLYSSASVGNPSAKLYARKYIDISDASMTARNAKTGAISDIASYLVDYSPKVFEYYSGIRTNAVTFSFNLPFCNTSLAVTRTMTILPVPYASIACRYTQDCYSMKGESITLDTINGKIHFYGTYYEGSSLVNDTVELTQISLSKKKEALDRVAYLDIKFASTDIVKTIPFRVYDSLEDKASWDGIEAKRVGGMIYYINPLANGAEYIFYDSNMNVVEPNVGSAPCYYKKRGNNQTVSFNGVSSESCKFHIVHNSDNGISNIALPTAMDGVYVIPSSKDYWEVSNGESSSIPYYALCYGTESSGDCDKVIMDYEGENNGADFANEIYRVDGFGESSYVEALNHDRLIATQYSKKISVTARTESLGDVKSDGATVNGYAIWYAIRRMNILRAKGCSDWYLPTANELNAMRINLSKSNTYVGNAFGSKSYGIRACSEAVSSLKDTRNKSLTFFNNGIRSFDKNACSVKEGATAERTFAIAVRAV